MTLFIPQHNKGTLIWHKVTLVYGIEITNPEKHCITATNELLRHFNL
jgi:hypothetical protein